MPLNVFSMILLFLYITVNGREFPISPTKCRNTCGNVTFEFPFGIGPGCSADEEHELSCENSSLLKFSHIPSVTKILEVTEKSMRVIMRADATCFDENTGKGFSQGFKYSQNPILMFSAAENKFVLVGCNSTAYFSTPDNQGYIQGCTSVCNGETTSTISNCEGNGCCKSTIPSNVNAYTWKIDTLNSASRSSVRSSCAKSFILDKGFSQYNLLNVGDGGKSYIEIPVVMDWVAANKSCADAANSSIVACKDYSTCLDAPNGHRCACKAGFEGNPYIPGGCQAVDKCKSKPCHEKATCTPTIDEDYICQCSTFYMGDGKIEGSGCKPILYYVYTVVFVFILLVLGFVSGLYYPRVKQYYRKRRNFRKNGGLLLEKKVEVLEKGIMEAYVISIEEIERMTYNFNPNRIIGKGGFGTVYLGMLGNGELSAIKVTQVVDQDQVNQFVNELSILLRIRHRSIVRVVACCLQRKDPIIAYEYATNGTLSEHLYKDDRSPIHCWKTRLNILAEIASSISYLHFEMKPEVLHKDIKSANVLLDKDYLPKLCDFGLASIICHEDQSNNGNEEDVMGTVGYIEPELFGPDGHYVKESDVYSFGILVLEVLTGKHAHVISSNIHKLEEPLHVILDRRISFNPREGSALQRAVDIGKRCIKKRTERPNMWRVTVELRTILDVL